MRKKPIPIIGTNNPYYKRSPSGRYINCRTKSERILTSKLKELENDDLIHRIVHQVVPPKVEYELTELGYSLKDLLTIMDTWGEVHHSKKMNY